MKAQTMKAKMEELGVLPSSGFGSLEVARDWVQMFVEWYNNKHRHSKINFVTPAQRHYGEDKAILANRELVLEKKRGKSATLVS